MMPRKRKFELSKFRNLTPFVPDNETISLFRQHLLGLPIFLIGLKGEIILRPPEYSQSVVLKKAEDKLIWGKAEDLIWRLSCTLAFFFGRFQIDIESVIKTRTHMVTAYDELLSCKKELMASGTIDEKTFKKTIWKWIMEYWEHIESPIPYLDKRTELVRGLYGCFKESFRGLRSDTVFYCIAHILKGFKLERGDVKQIFGRIKKDYSRKKFGRSKNIFSPS